MNNQIYHMTLKGQRVPYILQDDKMWIAIAPLCALIDADPEHECRLLNDHPWLSQHLVTADIAATDDAAPKPTLCLRERYVYGWLHAEPEVSAEQRAKRWEYYLLIWSHFRENEKAWLMY
jgi:hypothetical protein